MYVYNFAFLFRTFALFVKRWWRGEKTFQAIFWVQIRVEGISRHRTNISASTNTRAIVAETEVIPAHVQKINHKNCLCGVDRRRDVQCPLRVYACVYTEGPACTRKTLHSSSCVYESCPLDLLLMLNYYYYYYYYTTRVLTRDLRNVIEFNCQWAVKTRSLPFTDFVRVHHHHRAR